MKITLLDVDSQSRSYCYQKLMDIINRHKLPFTLVSASPESFEKEKDNRIIVIGQSLVRKYSSQINSLRKVNNQAIFLAFVPDYKLSAGFVEKLALLGIDEVFDADSTENEIKKRLVIVL
ncbi:MAG: hypothetical protein NZO16_06625, partial [Deltaproteobacteria bacterium]|nr:hypothetical protein [Deltaproteobacteria bacterium]